MVKKLVNYNGPLSVHDGKVLIADLKTKIHKYDGQCKVCKDEIKTNSVYQNDKICYECQYKLTPRWKLNKLKNTYTFDRPKSYKYK